MLGPTVLAGTRRGMKVWQEEVFGPVLSVIKFKDEAEALDIANDVRFGLGSGVWTSDIGRAIRMSERIQAGSDELQPPLPPSVREVHFVGGRDANVPPSIVASFQARHPAARIMDVAQFDHRCCWVERWPRLLDDAMMSMPTAARPL